MRNRTTGWILLAFLVFAAAAATWAVITVPEWAIPPLSHEEVAAIPDTADRLTVADNRTKLRNDMRVSMAQAITAAAVAAGLVFTYRTLRLNREGQLTERFTKAIDQLGQQDKPDVILGGIYSLARIARDSRADQTAIQDVLTAHVRRQGAYPPPPGGLPRNAPIGQLPSYRERLPTVHVALAVIAGLRAADDAVDLRKTDLRGADLEGKDMRGWRLREAHLGAAVLRGADLRGADLCGADLTDADLTGADLSNVKSDDRTRWPDRYRPAVPRQADEPAKRNG